MQRRVAYYLIILDPTDLADIKTIEDILKAKLYMYWNNCMNVIGVSEVTN